MRAATFIATFFHTVITSHERPDSIANLKVANTSRTH